MLSCCLNFLFNDKKHLCWLFLFFLPFFYSKNTVLAESQTAVRVDQVLTMQQDFSYTPSLSAAPSQPSGFSIENKPVWAKFDTTTGTVAGKVAYLNSPARSLAGERYKTTIYADYANVEDF